MWIQTDSDTERLYDAEIMNPDDDPEGLEPHDRSGVEFTEQGKAQVTKEVGEQLTEKYSAITEAGDTDNE